jgi:type II secretory pathway pseudopilin PulG
MRRIAALRRLAPSGDGGMTLVELGISLAGLAVIATMLTPFFVGVTRVDRLHEADDAALVTLRQVRQRITRDVREARGFVVASPLTMTVWLDADWDGIQDTGERVSWALLDDGSLARLTDNGGSVTVVGGLDPAASGFTYSSSSPQDIRTATIRLESPVAVDGGGDRSMEFDVSLRNMP